MSDSYSERKEKFKVKTLYIDRQADHRIVAWLDEQPRGQESAAIRMAIYHYLDNGGLDPAAIQDVIEQALTTHLADIRQIIDAALSNYSSLPLVGEATEGRGVEANDETAALLAALDTSLDIDDEEE